MESALAAPDAGARPLPLDDVLRWPAHGCAAADEVSGVVDEVADGGATGGNEAGLGRGDAVGAGGAEGQARVIVAVDKGTRGDIVALACRVEVGADLAG
jgi:hypothetical protein